MRTKIYLTVVFVPLLALLLNSPVQAGSKSATIRVSCTILPALQLSSSPAPQGLAGPSFSNRPAAGDPRSEFAMAAQDSHVYVNTNLGNQYRVNETVMKNNQNSLKLYSVTAL